MSAYFCLGLLWLTHVLPLNVQAWLGRGLGRLLLMFAKTRRAVALRNLELCFPEWSPHQRAVVAREHFQWLGRSLLERGLLWYASPKRLRQLIQIEGDVSLAERSERPVMWLVPHFVGLDVAGIVTQIFQKREVCSIYQPQSNPVFDRAIRKGRTRFGQGAIFTRGNRALPLVRAIRRGWAFFNLPDMDFGLKDSAFIPFFGVNACTLLAPSKMAQSLNMVVQPVVVEILPGGHGYRVQFQPPWSNFPTKDPQADAVFINQWIESEIRRNPNQYLWVHKRFKTRPPGEPSLYGSITDVTHSP